MRLFGLVATLVVSITASLCAVSLHDGEVALNAKRFDESLDIAQTLLQQNPNNPFAMMLLGLSYKSQLKFEDALVALQLAAKLSGGSVFSLGELAFAQIYAATVEPDLYSMQEALVTLERTIHAPRTPADHLILCNVLYEYSMLVPHAYYPMLAEKAVELHQEMNNTTNVKLGKFFVEAGLRFLNDLKVDEAVALADLALHHTNRSALAVGLRGLVHLKQRNFQTAEEFLEEASSKNPTNVAIKNNYAVVLQQTGKTYDAVNVFSEVIRLAPKMMEPHVGLGLCYQTLGDTENAKKMRLKSVVLALQNGDFGRAIHTLVEVAVMFPQVLPSQDAMARYVTTHARNIKYLSRVDRDQTFDLDYLGIQLPEALPPELLGEIKLKHLYDMPFGVGFGLAYYFAYSGDDNLPPRVDQAKFFSNGFRSIHEFYVAPFILKREREKTIRLGSLSHQLAFERNRMTTCRRPIRIGFLAQQFLEHTVSKLLIATIYGFSLLSENYEIHLVIAKEPLGKPRQEDVVTEQIAGFCASVTRLASPDVRVSLEQVTALELDILVYAELGMSGQAFEMAFHRVAEHQVVFWGHGITTGIQGTLDNYIASKLFLPREGVPPPRYVERVRMMEGLTVSFAMPKPDTSVTVEQVRAQFPENVRHRTLYLCAQSVPKIHPRMDNAIARVLLGDPTGTFVVIGDENVPAIKSLVHRITTELRRLGAPEETVRNGMYVLPFQTHAGFLAMYTAVNVTMDTWPFCGGVSHLEAMFMGAPVVVMDGHPFQPAISKGIYQHLDMDDLITSTEDEYVRRTLEVGTNRTLQMQLSAKIKRKVAERGICDGHTTIREEMMQEWGAMFQDLIAESDRL